MENTSGPGCKLQRLILLGIGAAMLLVGAVSAFLGPLEMYCFYFFSEGGRFHYKGFGFGSFMFGNLACQITGYYLIAIVFIPLGYGHLKTQRWARAFSVALVWFWLVVGVPLIAIFLFILLSSKDMSAVSALIAAIILMLSYLALPWVLIRFYQSEAVRLIFEAGHPQPSWIENLPVPVLVLSFLFLFYAIALHVLIFFRGIFPLFGVWLFNLDGIFAIDVSVMCLLLLTWGILKLKVWAWWGSLIYFSALAISFIFTLAQSSYLDLLSRMNFPPTEVQILKGIPFEGFHLAAFVGLPFVLTLGVIIFSKRHLEQVVEF